MNREDGGRFFKLTWDAKAGNVHFESNIPHIEILGILEVAKHALVRQMASGVGTGVLAEGRLQQPALQIRRADASD